MKRLGVVLVTLCMATLLPREASAQRLIPAHPAAPVAFTFPAVRDYTETYRVRRVHAVKRSVHRRPYARPRSLVWVRASRLYEISDWGYYALRTGWRPLPYEFGPYSARVVVLR